VSRLDLILIRSSCVDGFRVSRDVVLASSSGRALQVNGNVKWSNVKFNVK